MKGTHTPGPWYAGDSGPWVLAGDPKQSYNYVVSTPFTDGRDGPILPESEQRANACLIASAPELLEALQDFVKVHEFLGHADRPHYQAAKAAIAKAIGKSNAP